MHTKTSQLVLALFLSSTSAISVERNNYDRNVNYGRNGRRDIAETHIDPWVFDKVDPNVEWAPLMPRKDAPKRSSYTPPPEPRKQGAMASPEGGVNELGAPALSQYYNIVQYSPKFDGDGTYSPVWVEDFTDSRKFDKGVGGGIDQDSHPYPRKDAAYDVNGGANKFGPAVLAQTQHSPKFEGNGQYSPVWVEDFTDSKKFDEGVGGGIDQDTHPYPRRGTAYDVNGGANKFGPAVLAQRRHHRKHHKPEDFEPWERKTNYQWKDAEEQYGMSDMYDSSAFRTDQPAYNGGKSGWNLHQSAPFGRKSHEWKDIEQSYRMNDYPNDYEDPWWRPASPYAYNGGKAGWGAGAGGPAELGGLHQRRAQPLNDFDNLQNQMQSDMADFQRDKEERMLEQIKNQQRSGSSSMPSAFPQSYQGQLGFFSVPNKYSLAQAKDLDINCEFEDTYVCDFAKNYDVKQPSWQGQIDNYLLD